MTPTWQTTDGSVKLYLGDCLEVLPTLEAGSVDAVVTDPPYGVNFRGKNTKHTKRDDDQYASGVDDAAIGPAAVRISVERFNRVIVTPGAANAWKYPEPADIGGVYCPSGAGLGRWGFIGVHPILYYGKCPYLAKQLGHRPNSFQSFDRQDPNGHPCPKPLQWMLWMVRKATVSTGEAVLDPFMGSGTTGVACVRTGRKFIGIEKEPKYFDIAVKRIEAELNRAPLFDEAPAVVQARLF